MIEIIEGQNRYKNLIRPRTLFVFTDTAAKNSILSIVNHVCSYHQADDFLICSLTEFRSLIGVKSVISDFSAAHIREILDEFKPQMVFLGTSVKNYEWVWINEAEKLNIETHSFVDHFNSYKNRFVYDSVIYWPDYIYVLNENAKLDAKHEGVPEEKLIILRNPYYYDIESYKPEISYEDFLRMYDLKIESKVLLFISDSVSTHLPDLGFNEFSMLELLLNTLKDLQNKNQLTNNWNIIVKLHPDEDKTKFDPLVKTYIESGMKINVIKTADPKLLNYYADKVIGMFSNMVIESLLMNKPVLRIEIGQKRELLKFDEKNCVVVKEIEQLNEELVKFMD